MNSSRQTLALGRLLIREFSKTAPRSADEVVVTPKFKQLKENQKRFGIEDGRPVHLKGGLGDKLLYQATTVLTLTGVALSLEVFYRLIIK